MPKDKLPELNILLEAAMVVNAYMQSCNTGLSLRLYNATLDTKTICAVYFFANETQLNVKLGSYQLLSINHQ